MGGGGGGGSRSQKNIWSHAAARKFFFGLLGGLKNQCSGLAEIAFMDVSDLPSLIP